MLRQSRRDNEEPGSSKKTPKPWQEDEGGGGSFGSWLRRQRELRNITLREVADTTKISFRYLEALESDRFDVLPAGIFARGFLREYARYVGLDPDEAVNYYLAALQEQEEEVEEESIAAPAPSVGSRQLWIAIVVALLLLGAVVAVILLRVGGEEASSRPGAAVPGIAAPVVTPPLPEPVASRDERPASPITVTLDFTSDCWVEAVVDDRRRLSELRVQGESLRLAAEERIELVLGDGDAVRVEVNGEPWPLPAATGDRRDLTIDLQAVGAVGEPDRRRGEA